MDGQPFTLRMPARPDAVPRARHELAKIAFGYGVDSFAVKTVVSELVGNVVSMPTAQAGPAWSS